MSVRACLSASYVRQQNVKDYVKVVGLKWDKPEDEMPPPYGCTVFLYPSVCLVAARRYLFPVFGQVHVRNTWRCLKPVDPKIEYKVRVWVGGLPSRIVAARLGQGVVRVAHGRALVGVYVYDMHVCLCVCVSVQALAKVKEDVALVKRGVEVDFDQVLLDKDGSEVGGHWDSPDHVCVYWRTCMSDASAVRRPLHTLGVCVPRFAWELGGGSGVVCI